mmetsp:Transcript_2569/g.6396  ORF Transcript_2569/g.6396 Transcript_2569/m.6396 type:complete len:219 (-) Transcript_2569:1235-1891(-)
MVVESESLSQHRYYYPGSMRHGARRTLICSPLGKVAVKTSGSRTSRQPSPSVPSTAPQVRVPVWLARCACVWQGSSCVGSTSPSASSSAAGRGSSSSTAILSVKDCATLSCTTMCTRARLRLLTRTAEAKVTSSADEKRPLLVAERRVSGSTSTLTPWSTPRKVVKLAPTPTTRSIAARATKPPSWYTRTLRVGSSGWSAALSIVARRYARALSLGVA